MYDNKKRKKREKQSQGKKKIEKGKIMERIVTGEREGGKMIVEEHKKRKKKRNVKEK